MNKKLQILVIADDDETDRYLLKSALKDANLEADIIEKTDGLETIQFVEGECSIVEPKLIILDINMPIHSGFDVLEFKRKNPNLCNVPVFVFSTSTDMAHVNKAMELGASRYVSKPNNYSDYLKFANELKHFLDEAHNGK